MIIWLASFPRSGNTFLRMLLKQGLGLETYSLHEGDDSDFGSETKLSEIVGHIEGSSGLEIVEKARNSPDLHIIKTHQAPLTDDPAIFIVRDGRSAIVSYFHYRRDRWLSEITMEGIIGGDAFCGSWSSHYEGWKPETRPDTLLLRFENVTANPAEAIEQLSAFIGKPKIGDFLLSFRELKETSPKFFRSGSDSINNAEMESHLPKFTAYHGYLMRRLGYMTDKECVENLEKFVAGLNKDTDSSAVTYIHKQLDLIEKNAFERYTGSFAAIQAVIESLMSEKGVLNRLSMLEGRSLEMHQHTAQMMTALMESAAERHKYVSDMLATILNTAHEIERNS